MARGNGSPGGKIGERIATLIAQSRLATEARLGDEVQRRAIGAVEHMGERADREVGGSVAALLRVAADDPTVDPRFRALMANLAGRRGQWWGFLRFLLAPFAALALVQQLGRVYSQELVNSEQARLPNVPLSPEALATAVVQTVISPGQGTAEAALTGIDGERFDWLRQVTGNPPGPQELLQLWNRGRINEPDVDRGLRQSRLKNEWIDALKELRTVVAPPQDLIRFAVREAYSPEIARQFGQYEDFPAQAMGDASKVGVSRELMEKYWAAHWALPSAQQGFEMFHRGIISKSILKLLLRALDVMPFWRDKLIQMAYSPLRLVDIRRFYRDGVMTKEQVHDAYLSRGYSPENAELSTRWTIQQKMNTERDLTKAEIVSLYESQLLSRKKAHALVKDLGYDDSEADFILALPEARRERSRVTAGVRRVLTRYAARKIDRVRAATTLDRLEIPADERDELLQLAELEREITAPDLSVSQFQGLLRRGAISAERFTSEMRNRGYTDEEINWLGELSFPAPRATAST